MGFALCVFCGSGLGARPEFANAAKQVGTEIGRRGWTLVYGGGHVGLMGVVADATLAAGGKVVGVIPRFLHDKEVAHRGLSALEIVTSFAERKQRMGELSDAFLSLPGGVGTLDELFEAWSWTQAGLQRKPSGLLSVAGYYDDLVRFIERAEAEGFIRPASRRVFKVGTDVAALLDALSA
ncbi:MAG TPA: TIGR00730 family Rossman fold protein [Steroidobacteraceae bacterium]|nr:TIGR00730 family Rossman fold protein [Steroidobacteraceae bacterium]